MTTKLTKKQQELLARDASHNATIALIMSIIGIFFLGIILEPAALYYSIKSRRTLDNIHSQDGKSYAMATIALVISAIVIGVFVLAFIIGFMSGLSV